MTIEEKYEAVLATSHHWRGPLRRGETNKRLEAHKAAVLALCHAAYELGWYAGDGEYEEQKARIDALGKGEAQ